MSADPPLPGIIAPPPRLYIGVFVIAAVVQVASPLPIASGTPVVQSIGSVVLIASALLARWAFLTMRKVGTSANPRKESVALSTSGPFAFSRNPIYLAMTGLYVGASGLLNTWWPLLLLPMLLYIMNQGVIVREERYLLAQFGSSYASYKATVRRWL